MHHINSTGLCFDVLTWGGLHRIDVMISGDISEEKRLWNALHRRCINAGAFSSLTYCKSFCSSSNSGNQVCDYETALHTNTTVACEKLDPLFFLNNSMNNHRRTLKPSAICFYWPVGHVNFFYPFAHIAEGFGVLWRIFIELLKKNSGSNFSQATVGNFTRVLMPFLRKYLKRVGPY